MGILSEMFTKKHVVHKQKIKNQPDKPALETSEPIMKKQYDKINETVS